MIYRFSVLPFFLLICHSITAQTDLRKASFNINNNGVALQGYDPVAYFTENKAVKGSREWAVFADGITYYLSSAGNKELFLKQYSRYEPQYGGWCAYAMGKNGERVSIDPETFKILDGKLYLFYHSWSNNTLPKWNHNEADLKKRADQNWKNIFH